MDLDFGLEKPMAIVRNIYKGMILPYEILKKKDLKL